MRQLTFNIHNETEEDYWYDFSKTPTKYRYIITDIQLDSNNNFVFEVSQILIMFDGQGTYEHNEYKYSVDKKYLTYSNSSNYNLDRLKKLYLGLIFIQPEKDEIYNYFLNIFK